MFDKLGFIFWGFVIAALQFGFVVFIKFFWSFQEVGYYVTAQLFIAALVPLFSLDYHRRVDLFGTGGAAFDGLLRQAKIVLLIGGATAIMIWQFAPAYMPQVLAAMSAALFLGMRIFIKNNLSKYRIYTLDGLRWLICYGLLCYCLVFDVSLTLGVFGYVLAIANLSFIVFMPIMLSAQTPLFERLLQRHLSWAHISKSVGFIPYSLSGFLMTNIDRVFISATLGVVELGLYAWIQNLAAPLKIVTNNLTLLYSRFKFTSETFDNRREVRQQSIIIGLSAIGLFLIGSAILIVWPIATQNAPIILAILILANMVRGAKQYVVVNNYEFLKLRKPLSDLMVTIAGTILLLPLLQLHFGLMGIAFFSLGLGCMTVIIWRQL